jgi:hypothetical protein
MIRRAHDETTVIPKISSNVAASGGNNPYHLGIAICLDIANVDDASIAMSGDRSVESILPVAAFRE